MKKLILSALILTLIFCAVACGNLGGEKSSGLSASIAASEFENNATSVISEQSEQSENSTLSFIIGAGDDESGWGPLF